MEQLAKMLGDPAEVVAQFRHPLSRQLLLDILDEHNDGDLYLNVKCQHFRLEVQIHVVFDRPDLGRSLQPECDALVVAYASDDDWSGAVRRSPPQPRTPAGLNKLLHWAQETVANFKRRGGFCQPCLELEPPRKRLRVHGQTRCVECFLQEYLE